MWVNIFGNRSYNDISQYPVFPWILSFYEGNLKVEQKKNHKSSNMHFIPSFQGDLENTLSSSAANVNDLSFDEDTFIDYLYRDLSLPMGMLEISPEGVKRKTNYRETFSSLKNDSLEDDKIKPYTYGSNYSNPVYVCYYLMRLFPFTHISIELQGHGFDDPNRLFLSINNSFENSTSQQTDIRELIPEFYYLPEMFLNLNNLDMGILDDGTKVGNVLTPCNNDPFEFIMIMKTVLESNQISNTIQNWIDLIFGYKAYGKEAELANNVFTEASYQEYVYLDNNPHKEAYLRMVEFGLIPTQILSKECSKKDKKEEVLKEKELIDPSIDLTFFKCYNKNILNDVSKDKYKNDIYVLKLGVFGPEKLSLAMNSCSLIEKKISYSMFEKVYNEENNSIIKFSKLSNRMKDFQYPKEYNDKNILFINHGKTIIMGGFYDGKIMIISTEPELSIRELVPFTEDLPILAIAVDKEEEFLFVGNSNGNVLIYPMGNEENDNQWRVYKRISDQMSPITHIDCNNELNLWISASDDGYINLYTLPLCKLVRCIKTPFNKIDHVFLTTSPLPSIILMGEGENVETISKILVYSINGKYLNQQNEDSTITSPIIIRDLNSNEYLTYIKNNNVIIRSLPNLFIQVTIDNLPNIYAICPSEDMTILYAVNQSASEIYVIRDESRKTTLPIIPVKIG